VLARTLTSLSALSGGRVILGIGAGTIWDMIVKLGSRPARPAPWNACTSAIPRELLPFPAP
jgi:hypothetical protein